MRASDRRSRVADRGFTYLWTLVAVALLGVGVMIARDVERVAAQREREAELLYVGSEFRRAIESYLQAGAQIGRRDYPPTLDDLIRDSRTPQMKRHLRRIHRDPVTGRAEWGVVRVGNGIAGVHSLSDKAPLKIDGFDPENAGFRNRDRYREWVFSWPPDLSTPPVAPPANRPGAPERDLRPNTAVRP